MFYCIIFLGEKNGKVKWRFYYKFIKLVKDIKEDLKIEKTDESLFISSGNENTVLMIRP